MDRKVIVTEEQIKSMILESTTNILRENEYDETRVGDLAGKIAQGFRNIGQKFRTGRDQYNASKYDTGQDVKNGAFTPIDSNGKKQKVKKRSKNAPGYSYVDKSPRLYKNGKQLMTFNPVTQRNENMDYSTFWNLVNSGKINLSPKDLKNINNNYKNTFNTQQNMPGFDDAYRMKSQSREVVDNEDNYSPDNLSYMDSTDGIGDATTPAAQPEGAAPAAQQAGDKAGEEKSIGNVNSPNDKLSSQNPKEGPLWDFKEQYGLTNPWKFASFSEKWMPMFNRKDGSKKVQGWVDFFASNPNIIPDYKYALKAQKKADKASTIKKQEMPAVQAESKYSDKKIRLTEEKIKEIIKQVTIDALDNI